uniref:D-aspartate oxidase n=1 Tax=Cacopsylla melanoneura TaxID=428564 RepID=A0A8D9AUD4_9HEMI
MDIKDLKLCIIGAGVVGLNTALELQAVYPSCNLTIIAKEFTINTTSHGAAGIFRPGISFSGPTDEVTLKWIEDSYHFYSKLLLEARAGVRLISGYNLSNISSDLTKNSAIENLVPVYRDATSQELFVGNKTFKYGSYSETLVIENSDFLPWAMKRVSSQGAKFKRGTVVSLSDLGAQFDVVFNCTGLGAQALCKDRKLTPMKGQIIKVFAPWLSHFYYLDYDVYIIPHSNGSVTLGGVRHYDSYSLDINPHDTSAILERCYSLLPELEEAPVLYEWCGLRPHRSLVRVETEKIGKLNVIHNYGHGGYGVTTAPGTAKHAVRLCQELLQTMLLKAKL